MKFFDSPEMRETLHRLLRSQMALKGIDYNGLSQRLSMMGVVPNGHQSKIQNQSRNPRSATIHLYPVRAWDRQSRYRQY